MTMISGLFRISTRVLFVVVAVAVLTIAKSTDYGWTGPILIVMQIVLVALVRLSWSAHDKWAREYVAWLNTGSVDAWTAWHRAYVTWSAEHAGRVRPRQRITDAELDAYLHAANGRMQAALDRHVDTEAGLRALLLRHQAQSAGHS